MVKINEIMWKWLYPGQGPLWSHRSWHHPRSIPLFGKKSTSMVEPQPQTTKLLLVTILIFVTLNYYFFPMFCQKSKIYAGKISWWWSPISSAPAEVLPTSWPWLHRRVTRGGEQRQLWNQSPTKRWDDKDGNPPVASGRKKPDRGVKNAQSYGWDSAGIPICVSDSVSLLARNSLPKNWRD